MINDIYSNVWEKVREQGMWIFGENSIEGR